MVILETKHAQKLDDSAIAQVLEYYCKSQGTRNSCEQGLAMLFRATKEDIEVIIFLFPYYGEYMNKGEDSGYGIQALMLPLYKCKHEEFVESKFLDFLLVFTSSHNKTSVFRLTLPTNDFPLFSLVTNVTSVTFVSHVTSLTLVTHVTSITLITFVTNVTSVTHVTSVTLITFVTNVTSVTLVTHVTSVTLITFVTNMGNQGNKCNKGNRGNIGNNGNMSNRGNMGNKGNKWSRSHRGNMCNKGNIGNIGNKVT